MADPFYITASMGNRKKKIFIDPSLTLQDLAVKVEEVFSVHRQSQKLILKGRLLSKKDASLQSLGVKKGETIMVLGKVIHTEKDDLMETLEKFDNSYKEEKLTVDDIFARLESEWDSKSNDQKALQATMKKLLCSNEQLMKLLEAIDGIQMTVSCDEIRQKRRGIVHKIQKLMDEVDREYKDLQTFVKPSS